MLNWIVQFQTVLTECGGRKVLFNNKTTDESKKVEQVQQFLAHVASIEELNDGKSFTHEMHRKIKVKIVVDMFTLPSALLYKFWIFLVLKRYQKVSLC